MGKGRADPCSKHLKREYLAQYMNQNYDRADTVMCLGITAHEYSDRWFHINSNWTRQGWVVEAPLADDATITRESMMASCLSMFGFIPRLYLYDFDHNNCGGACIKAGQKQWARLLHYLPDVYAWWETNEEAFRLNINPDIAILRRQVNYVVSPLPLKVLRLELQERWKDVPPDYPEVKRFANLESTPACAYCEAA